MTPRPNQLLTAAELLNQNLVELATGQGKTLAAALAAAVAGLAGATVHLLTANPYLARRDQQENEVFYTALGLTSSSAHDGSGPEEKRAAYAQDICYTTARTLAFDFLRDQSLERSEPVLRGLCFAIIDEADSLLIDEASMPLVLSEQSDEPALDIDYTHCLQLAAQLKEGTDFEIEPTGQRTKLRDGALTRLRLSNNPKVGINAGHQQEIIEQALVALHLLKRDKHYIVKKDEVLLIDQTTGRTAPGRVLPGYLQALVCTLENIVPPAVSRRRTGLTYPRFFARYHHLCGLSGTLKEAQRELRQSYGLKLSQIPPHQRSRLIRYRTRAFTSQSEQFTASIRQAARLSRAGRAVLIGTDTVEDARRLARGFARARIKVALLDAANEEYEARRIQHAGRAGQITISTQIAGRGTDIRLDDVSQAAGGLHVLSLQHNRSHRIDRQMAGRAARQGDPGSCEHWIVLTDSPFDPKPKQVFAFRLRPLLRLLARAGLAAAIVNLMQHLWLWQDRSQRYTSLRADIDSAQSLQVSTMKHL